MLELFSVSAVASCLFALLIVGSNSWHGQFTMDHDLTGVQKFHTRPVPRIGGVALFFGVLIALGYTDLYVPALPESHTRQMLLLVASSLPVFAAGVVEDLTKTVSPIKRLVASFCSAALGSVLLGATLDGIDIVGIDTLLQVTPIAIVVTAIIVAGGTNAINIIDGFNGLASTVALIMLAGLGILAWQTNDMLIAQLVLLAFGATLGVLFVNYPTGRIFLGDGGAYVLGFFVSEIAVLLLVRNPEIGAWHVLAVCAYPVIEVLYSIFRRKIVRKASPGAPDNLHLHTLIYRRLLGRGLFPVAAPWKRNAAVVLTIAPATVATTCAALFVGSSTDGAIAVVALEFALYIAVYKRLIRGRWFWSPAPATARMSESTRDG